MKMLDHDQETSGDGDHSIIDDDDNVIWFNEEHVADDGNGRHDDKEIDDGGDRSCDR